MSVVPLGAARTRMPVSEWAVCLNHDNFPTASAISGMVVLANHSYNFIVQSISTHLPRYLPRPPDSLSTASYPLIANSLSILVNACSHSGITHSPAYLCSSHNQIRSTHVTKRARVLHSMKDKMERGEQCSHYSLLSLQCILHSIQRSSLSAQGHVK